MNAFFKFYELLSTLLLSTLLLVSGFIPWDFSGTTPGIKEIIIGRCTQFEQLNYQNRIPALYIDVDCTKVWNLFSSSFSFKDSCRFGEVTEKSYESFFNLVGSKVPLTNQALFWSGTRHIVHEYTSVESSYFTLEDTFPGYIANDLKWCGCQSCLNGIDYISCNKTCSFSTLDSYWSGASRLFAQNAKGTAYVMVNGTAGPGFTAYYNMSYFGRIELPTMGKMKQVNRLVVIVVNDLDTEIKEKCGKGSLANLVEDAITAGIQNVECIDQPKAAIFLLCAKYPNAKQCVSMINGKNIN